jgi:hypothetical protein
MLKLLTCTVYSNFALDTQVLCYIHRRLQRRAVGIEHGGSWWVLSGIWWVLSGFLVVF